MTITIEPTFLSEVEQYVLTTLGSVGQGYGLQLPEGGMTKTAGELIEKGLVEEIFGFYALIDAGRSRLHANR